MLHQNEGGIGKYIPNAQEISRDPRDFMREILREIHPVDRERLTVLKSAEDERMKMRKKFALVQFLHLSINFKLYKSKL